MRLLGPKIGAVTGAVLLALCFCTYAQAGFTLSVASELFCEQLLMSAPDEVPELESNSAATKAYVSLLHTLVAKKNLFDVAAVERLLEQNEVTNPFEVAIGAGSAEERYAYRIAFERIIRSGTLDWNVVKEAVRVMFVEKQNQVHDRKRSKLVTAGILKPLPLNKIPRDEKNIALGRSLNGLSFDVLRDSTGNPYLSFGRFMVAGATVPWRSDFVVDVARSETRQLPFAGVEQPWSTLEHNGKTLVSYALEERVVVFDLATGTQEWEISYKELDPQWPRPIDPKREGRQATGAEFRAGRKPETVLFLDKAQGPQLMLRWTSMEDNGAFRIDLASRTAARLSTGGNKLFVNGDKTRVFTAKFTADYEWLELSVYDLASDRLVFKQPVKLGKAEFDTPEIAVHEDAAGQVYVALSLTGRVYAWNVEQNFPKIFTSARPDRPEIAGFFETEKGTQLVLEEGGKISVLDLSDPESAPVSMKLHQEIVYQEGFLVIQGAQKFYVQSAYNDKGELLIVTDLVSGDSKKFGLKDVDAGRLIAVYSTRDGRIEAIYDSHQSFTRVQIFGPIPEK